VFQRSAGEPAAAPCGQEEDPTRECCGRGGEAKRTERHQDGEIRV